MTYIKKWFSNMKPVDEPFVHRGITYTTVENFYQAMKSLFSEEQQQIADMDPWVAKRYGYWMKKRDDWNDIRLKVMEYGLRKKFAPGTSWPRALMETGEEEIVDPRRWKGMTRRKTWNLAPHPGWT